MKLKIERPNGEASFVDPDYYDVTSAFLGGSIVKAELYNPLKELTDEDGEIRITGEGAQDFFTEEEFTSMLRGMKKPAATRLVATITDLSHEQAKQLFEYMFPS